MPAYERAMIIRNGKAGQVGFAVFWLVAVMLGGCDDKEGKIPTQVAARVNDAEITIHQVNDWLGRSGFSNEAAAREESRKILDSLIDQELLVQQAKRKKLDRDPVVMQSMEDAKRQILSQAYLERMVYNHTPPSPAESKEFYAKYPELFSKRKAYKFHVFSIPKDKFNDGLKYALDSAKTVGEIASLLKNKEIDFKEDQVQWLAEQIPMGMLATIAKIKVGEIVSLEQGSMKEILLLESAVDYPVDETQAQPVIQKYILNSRNKELLDNKLKQLRAGEQITYVGQFAETQSSTAPPVPKTKEPQASQPDDFIQKGLQGLQ